MLYSICPRTSLNHDLLKKREVLMEDHNFNQIEEMKQELLQMGYYQFQIDGLVREVVHTTQLKQLSATDLEQLAKALESHLTFARKCHHN
jgi:hypothetical protein